MWVARYEARRATHLRFGVWDTELDRWVTDWQQHSFPVAEGVAEHRAWYLNCDEASRES